MKIHFYGVVLSALLLAGGNANADFGTASVTGRVVCTDGGAAPVPLEHVRIQAIVSHSSFGTRIGDYIIGQGYTMRDGSFNFAAHDFFNRPWGNQLYVQVVLNDDQGAELKNPDQYFTDWFANSSGLLDDGGTFDYGLMTIGTATSGVPAACAVWANARSAFQEYLQVTGGVPPPAGSYTILFWSAVTAGVPWSDTTTTNWPTNFPAELRTARHEFAHTVRHRFDGEEGHFFGDVGTFNYLRQHFACFDAGNLGFSFNEGWAEFWSDDTGHLCGDPNNMQLEGNNATALATLAACPGVGKKGMLPLLNAHPASNAGGIHSFIQFSSDLTAAVPSCVFKGVPTPPLTGCDVGGHARSAAAPEPPRLVPVAQVRASAQARLQSLDRAAAELERAQPGALAAAASPPPCTEKSCSAAIDALLGPPGIRATLAQAKLVHARLADELAGLDSNPHGLNGEGCARNADFYQWLQRYQLELRGQLVAIAATALSEELAALAPLRAASPEAANLIRVLDEQRTQLTSAPDAPLPPQLQLPPALLGERLDRIPSPSPVPVPRTHGCDCQLWDGGVAPPLSGLLLAALLWLWRVRRRRTTR